MLVALAVDAWQQEREEKQRLRGQLVSLVGEIDQNLFTIETIQDYVLPKKIDRLGKVIDMLEGIDSAPVLDKAFVDELALSTTDAQLWFTRNSYDAVLNSGGFKHLEDMELEAYLSGAFNSAETLLRQPLYSRAEYASTVNGLLPTVVIAESNPMRGYVGDDVLAPTYGDSVDYRRVSEAIFEDRANVVRLARNGNGLCHR